MVNRGCARKPWSGPADKSVDQNGRGTDGAGCVCRQRVPATDRTHGGIEDPVEGSVGPTVALLAPANRLRGCLEFCRSQFKATFFGYLIHVSRIDEQDRISRSRPRSDLDEVMFEDCSAATRASGRLGHHVAGSRGPVTQCAENLGEWCVSRPVATLTRCDVSLGLPNRRDADRYDGVCQ